MASDAPHFIDDVRLRRSQLLTSSQAAGLLAVSVKTLGRRAGRDGFPKAYRLGGSNKLIRFRLAEIEQYLCRLAEDADGQGRSRNAQARHEAIAI